MKVRVLAAAITLAFAAGAAQAQSYFEDFEAPFPAWESGWLGSNSNLTNVYGVGQGRGNNPDGLWIGQQDIVFNPVFGAGITSLSFDVASWVYGTIEFYDSANALISSQVWSVNYGAYTDPGTYQHFSVTSGNGISHFYFNGYGVVGNTSIDNVAVNSVAQPVPEPETYALMLAGLGLLGVAARRRKQMAAN